jgi:hypothetical protein
MLRSSPRASKTRKVPRLTVVLFDGGHEPSDQVSLAAENVVKGLHFHVSHISARVQATVRARARSSSHSRIFYSGGCTGCL